MARKKSSAKKKASKSKGHTEWLGFELNPETKHGIVVVVLFAAAALLFLSFFNIAGTIGIVLDSGMSALFGWDRFFIPVILIFIGATLLFPERGTLSPWNYIGLLFFFLSINALTNVFLFRLKDVGSPSVDELKTAGGILGEFLARLIPYFAGNIAAIVILIALLFVSLLLVFNTSLRNILTAHTHITGKFGAALHGLTGRSRRYEDDKEDEGYEEDEEEEEGYEEDEGEDEEEIEAEEADAEETRKAFRTTTMAAQPIEKDEEGEKVITSKTRRKPTLSLKLLDLKKSKPESGDIERNKELIRKTFENFNIDVEMHGVSVGPTVTQYELRPADGVKLSRIVALQNDLALALAAHPIRIEAPIPGKSLVGIEIPNQTIAMIYLRELLQDKSFKRCEAHLPVALGKDVAGKVWTAPLEKMPHLLVAGATGSGKSVCLNTIIVALLYQNSPDDLRLIMVDPKRVELTIYDKIPHLLVPPITKVDDTVNALKWTVREMERRLDTFSKVGARDISSYNNRMEERMPRIVIFIDELADLMAASGNEVENSIVRIAQMARAAGIHLVLATQRPSVDVITGTIKANFPSRIAFAVASQTDSRTILDIAGAEKLIGRGDMLYHCAELSKPKRIQGAFISEAEVKRVVRHLRKESLPDYNIEIIEHHKDGSVFSSSGDDDEPLLDEAAKIVVEAGKASTSFLQRRLKIGYSRAARIIDMLEDAGVVGPSSGSKAREILVEEWPISGGRVEGIPTAQDDLDEAAKDFDEDDYEIDEDEDDIEDDVLDEEEDEEDFEEEENLDEDEETDEEDYEPGEDEEIEEEELEEDEEYEDNEEYEKDDFESAQEGEYLDESEEEEDEKDKKRK